MRLNPVEGEGDSETSYTVGGEVNGWVLKTLSIEFPPVLASPEPLA